MTDPEDPDATGHDPDRDEGGDRVREKGERPADAALRGESESRRPRVEDVDPSALAVSSVDDSTRMHRGGDETDVVETDAGLTPVDEDAEERRAGGGYDDHDAGGA